MAPTSTEKNIIAWKVWYYYENKIRVYSSNLETWNDLPIGGLQFQVKHIKRSNEILHLVLSGCDAYVLSYAEFVKAPFQHVKFGSWIPDAKLKEIRALVTTDKETWKKLYGETHSNPKK